MDNFKKRWKTIPCFSGEACWCRCIVTEDYIQSDDDDEKYIVGSAAMDKETAEYFVTLHNEKIDI